jgi:transposase
MVQKIIDLEQEINRKLKESLIMLRTIKYELCPNKSQRILIKKTCGCARLIYNLSLAKKNHEYEANGSSLSEYDLNNELTKLKKKQNMIFLMKYQVKHFNSQFII